MQSDPVVDESFSLTEGSQFIKAERKRELGYHHFASLKKKKKKKKKKKTDLGHDQ